MLVLYCQYVFSLFTTILFVFFTGFYLGQLLLPKQFGDDQNGFVTSGLSLSIGFVIVTTFTAVFFTHFKTIFIWPFGFLIFGLMTVKKGNLRAFSWIPKGLDLKTIFVIICLLLIVYSYHFWVTSASILIQAFSDVFFYGKVSSGLLLEGIENTRVFNNNYLHVTEQNLYHYGDLWINGITSLVFNLPEVHVLRLVVYPLLHFITLLLSISVFSKRISPSFRVYFWGGIAMLYGIGLFVALEGDIWSLVTSYRGFPQLFFSYKLLPIYIICLLSILFFYNDQFNYSLIFLSFVPIFYSTTLPAIGGCAGGLLLFSAFNSKYRFSPCTLKVYQTFYVFGGLMFVVIYQLIFPFDSLVKLSLEAYSLKTYLVFVIETIIKLFGEHPIVLIVLIIMLIINVKKVVLNPIVVLSVFGVMGAFVFVYMHSPGIADLNQVITNIAPVMLLILSFELFSFLKKPHLKFVIWFMLLSGLNNLLYFNFHQRESVVFTGAIRVFSQEFIQKTKDYINNFESDFISGAVDNNFMLDSKNVTYLRWNYDLTTEYDFILSNPKVRPPLELGPVFEKELNFYCTESINTDYPPCNWFSGVELTDDNIVHVLRMKKMNHLFIKNSEKISVSLLNELELLLKDSETGTTLWRIKNVD